MLLASGGAVGPVGPMGRSRGISAEFGGATAFAIKSFKLGAPGPLPAPLGPPAPPALFAGLFPWTPAPGLFGPAPTKTPRGSPVPEPGPPAPEPVPPGP